MTLSYKDVESIYAVKHKVPLSKGNKDIGDFYVKGVAYNVKSNNLKRKNFMPRMVSADKLYNYLQEPKNNLMIVFVDHKDNKIIKDEYVKIEHISFDCLGIECQGLGLLMMKGKLKIDIKQTREQFLNKLVYEYKHNYIPKERKKLDFLEEKYV